MTGTRPVVWIKPTQTAPSLEQWLEAAAKIGVTLLVGFSVLSVLDEAFSKPKKKKTRQTPVFPTFIEDDELSDAKDKLAAENLEVKTLAQQRQSIPASSSFCFCSPSCF